MDQTVFKNDTCAEFINDKFVSLRITVDGKNWKEMSEKFSLRGTPTVLLFKPDGSEIERLTGYDGNNLAYLDRLRDYAQNKNTLNAYLANVEENPNSAKANKKVAQRYLDRWERDKAVPYLKKILELDPQNELQFHDVAECNIAIDQLFTEDDPSALKSFIAQTSDNELLQQSYGYLVRYYGRKKDQTQMVKTYEEAVKRLPPSASYYNQYAWFIYEQEIEDKYERGIELASKAVEMQPDAAHIWDTLGWLYYANGQKAKAIEAMQKAVELEPDAKSYKENLAKFSEGDVT